MAYDNILLTKLIAVIVTVRQERSDNYTDCKQSVTTYLEMKPKVGTPKMSVLVIHCIAKLN